MPNFENYSREAQDIEREIVRRGLVLNIDWQDPVQVSALAREALACRDANGRARPDDPQVLAKTELFGLAQLMLSVMRQSADDGMLTHGGPVWKVFGRALWKEAGL